MLFTPTCSLALKEAAAAGKTKVIKSPITLPKAIKNKTELEGFRQCHIRDAAALISYFAWLENELEKGTVLNEVDGADKLEEFRSYSFLYFPFRL